uniref:Uncharacterized protein n=1 Tax=Branchiostoma floridae TaxID=7739 RepID=C3Y7E6_BRAFL|eukprot:XP_002607764.1 hypothetical protein BRAFLDRAFT_82787 [Branchiostoma floridae]
MGNCLRTCHGRGDTEVVGASVPHHWPNGDPGERVFRTEHLTNGIEDDAIVHMYPYTSIPPVDGTYVVLQFKDSEMYVASKEGKPRVLTLEDPEEFDPEDAEDITTTADRRVFLMKPSQPGSSDVVYASCVASKQNQGQKDKALVITLFKNTKRAARLTIEGKRAILESQRFQTENVPTESGSEHFDECPDEEVQLHD